LKALFRFFQLSCASFVTNFGLTLALHEWGQVSEEAAFAMALAVVLVLNFVVMRWYIYEEAQAGTIWQQIGLYLCSAVVFCATEYGAFLLWHTWYGSDYRVAVVGITAISAGLKFFYYRVLFERRGRLRMAPAAATTVPYTSAALTGERKQHRAGCAEISPVGATRARLGASPHASDALMYSYTLGKHGR
jgi:CDP-diglyceride synthetase